MAFFYSALSILHSAFEQRSFWLNVQFGSPKGLAAMDGVFKIQCTGQAKRTNLTFIDLRYTIYKISDVVVPAVSLSFFNNCLTDLFSQSTDIFQADTDLFF